MYCDGKTVLLAGATGMVGRSILARLVAECPKTRVRAVIHERAPMLLRSSRVEYIRADLRQLKDCLRVVRGCDAAIMAAAQTGGAQSAQEEPWRQVTDNVVMNTHFFQACYDQGVQRVVCLGSATLYQLHEGLIREQDLTFDKDPHASYFGIGWVSRFVEKLGAFWHKSAGIQVVFGRCANIYGPFAVFDPQRANFIPALVRKAVDRKDPFEVWGSADVTRDVVYSDDAAAAVLAMMNAEGIGFDVFNIGSGMPVSVGDVVAWALKYAAHVPQKVVYRSDKPVTIRSRILDISKARRMLDWSPQVGPEEGIQRTMAWWQENRRHWKR
jgi:GDP-L-fucose synthase